MNPIEISLRRIFNTIPEEILDAAFTPNKERMSLDACVHEKVIVGRVLHDCTIFAGRLKDIVLRREYAEPSKIPSAYVMLHTDSYCVYRIPADVREHKNIVSVISVNYPYNIYGSTKFTPPQAGNVGGNTVGNLASAVLESHTYANAVVTPTPILLTGNCVKLYPQTLAQLHTVDWVLKCRLSYDEQFTNLSPSAIKPLADLCECAVKAYIYNQLVLKIDRAMLIGGMEHGRFREIVDSYAAENEKYNELLLQFRGAATTLDPESFSHILKYIV